MPAARVPRLRKSRIARGSALAPAVSVLGPPMEAPEAPDGLSEQVQADWTTFWASPQASHVVSAQLPALIRLFRMYEQRERFLTVGLEEPVLEGSTGQSVLHPLLKAVDTLDTKILALEDRFGLSPKSSVALAGEFDDATDAAARANKALSAGFGPPTRPKQPRRLAAVE